MGHAVLPWLYVDCAALAGSALEIQALLRWQQASPPRVKCVCFGQMAQARLLSLGQSTHPVQARHAVQHAPGRTGCCGGGRRHLRRVPLCQVEGQTQHSQGNRDTGQAGQQELPAAAWQHCSAACWRDTLQGQHTRAVWRGAGSCWVACTVMPAAVGRVAASHVRLSTAAVGRRTRAMQDGAPARPAQRRRAG